MLRSLFRLTQKLSADIFRQCRSSIIMAFQHQGKQQFSYRIMLPLFHIELYLGHSGCIGGNTDLFLHLCIFQHQNAGHDLGGAGHCHGSLFIFSI